MNFILVKRCVFARWLCPLLLLSVLSCSLFASESKETDSLHIEPVDFSYAAKIGMASSIRSIGFDSHDDHFAHISPRPGNGIVHARAMQVKNDKIAVAIDSDQPDAKSPNILRLDFTARGNFVNAMALQLKKAHKNRYIIEPNSVISFEAHGLRGTANVSGSYMCRINGNKRYLSIQTGSALCGELRIGKQLYKVRFIDGNSNLRYLDRWSIRLSSGDLVSVSSVDGESGKETLAASGFVGQPLWLNNAFYVIDCDLGNRKLTARELSLPRAEIKADCRSWRAILIHDEYLLRIDSHGDGPITVPAGKYVLANLVLRAQNHSARAGSNWPEIEILPGREPQVITGEPIVLTVTQPVTIGQSPANAGNPNRNLFLSFSLEAKDQCGHDLRLSWYPEIKLFIRDAAGSVVHQGVFEYG